MNNIKNAMIPLFFLLLGGVLCPAYSQSTDEFATLSVEKIGSLYGITQWWISDVIPVSKSNSSPSDSLQKTLFLSDDLNSVSFSNSGKPEKVEYRGQKPGWKKMEDGGGMFYLNDIVGQENYAIVLACTRIIADNPQKIFLGVGSDDAIKIYLNGEKVHENWVARGLNPDDDILALDLKEGTNTLLLKIQNIEQGWGFQVRTLAKDKLVDYSYHGQLDKIQHLLELGADPNATNSAGLTPLNAAKIAGRKEIAEYLEAQGAKESPIPAFSALVDKIFIHADNDSSPGAAILLAKDGKVIYEKGYGYADIDRKIPANSQTKFRIGSVTKQFTAAAIMKLVEEGKLELEDKISAYFPDFPRGDEVTIHHLLTHTSGIHSYTNLPDFVENVTEPTNDEEVLKKITDQPFDFNPGEQWAYNNSGYYLLGIIIEKVSGLHFAEYFEKHFFSPLEMKNTGLHKANQMLDFEAIGYTYEHGVVKLAHNWDMTWAGAAGALYSTTKDLLKWNAALYGGKVVSEQSLKKMITPVTQNNGDLPNGVKYGYGLILGEHRGMEYIGHGGGLHGFLSYLGWIPEEKTTIIVFSNATPGPEGVEPSRNAMEIGTYYFWEKLDPQETAALDTNIKIDDLKSYEGRYDYGRGAVLIIKVEKDKIRAQLTGQPQFEVFPSGPDEIFWKVVDARLEFTRDENGLVTGGTHFQNGQQFNVTKLPEIKRWDANSEDLSVYEGVYDMGNGFHPEVIYDDDKLFIKSAQMPKSELIPVAENTFSCREVNLTIKFNLNEKGEAQSAEIKLAGSEQLAPKIKK